MLFGTKTRLALTLLCSHLMLASNAHALTTFDLDIGFGPGVTPQTIAPGSVFTVRILMTVDGTATGYSVSVDLGAGGDAALPMSTPPPGVIPAGTPTCDPTLCESFAGLGFFAIPAGTYEIGTFELLANGSFVGLPLQLGFFNPGVDGISPLDETVVFNPLLIPEPSTGTLVIFGLTSLATRVRRRGATA